MKCSYCGGTGVLKEKYAKGVKSRVDKARRARIAKGQCAMLGCPNPRKSKWYCEEHLARMRKPPPHLKRGRKPKVNA